MESLESQCQCVGLNITICNVQMFTGAERLRNVSGEWSKFQSRDPSDDNRGLGTAATCWHHHESPRPI